MTNVGAAGPAATMAGVSLPPVTEATATGDGDGVEATRANDPWEGATCTGVASTRASSTGEGAGGGGVGGGDGSAMGVIAISRGSMAAAACVGARTWTAITPAMSPWTRAETSHARVPSSAVAGTHGETGSVLWALLHERPGVSTDCTTILRATQGNGST
jgi:hypothetical protein